MLALYADDEMDDLYILREIVEILNPSFKIMEVGNGQEALDFLGVTTILPDLIILDINMPIMDGRSCLKFIKKDPRFSQIPVIIFSTSIHQKDIELCHQLGALACIEKPVTFEDGFKRLG